MHKADGWYWHGNQNGICQGRLWGGCLEVLDLHLSRKAYLPDLYKFDDMILFLETSEEMPSDGFVYRFISALAELKILQKFKAILMAYPKTQFCDKKASEGREAFITNQRNAVIEALKDYEVPIGVVFNMNFGHTDPQTIIPSGSLATIDFTHKTIQF
jgi:muramoyltetrapeptide carboxypeptidase LdcA involved in peptidoglycan recycling